MILFALLFALAAEPSGILEGRLQDGSLAMGGVKVTLRDGALVREEVTDDSGDFVFRDLPVGTYELSFDPEMMEPFDRVVVVWSGTTHAGAFDVKRPQGSLSRPCRASTATKAWQLASCEDWDRNTSLIAAARENDSTALAELEQRLASTISWSERLRIETALLGKLPDDTAIWNELSQNAEYALRSESSDDAEAFAESERRRKISHPGSYNEFLVGSFSAIKDDRRARLLLFRALHARERDLVALGIEGLANQHDGSALAEIDEALSKFEDLSLVLLLRAYGSPAAEAIMRKHVQNGAVLTVD